jgi:hypothetical protein
MAAEEYSVLPASSEDQPLPAPASIFAPRWPWVAPTIHIQFALEQIRNQKPAIEILHMAGFRMHVSTSALLGCGYAAAGHAVCGVPLDTAIVSGAMCGVAGMLPDLDSDNGVPLRETMAFTAAIVPMLLVGRFQTLALSHDGMALAAVSLYLFVRFGITNIIRKYTVHRGMFHSIPAGLVFAGLAFIVSGAAPLEFRCYKAGGVLAGFMSHLLLDEI